MLNNFFGLFTLILKINKFKVKKKTSFKLLLSITSLEKEIPRVILGLNYLSKFVCTQWAVWLMYSSSWILVGWKFFSLTNNNASSVFTNLYYVKFYILFFFLISHLFTDLDSHSGIVGALFTLNYNFDFILLLSLIMIIYVYFNFRFDAA